MVLLDMSGTKKNIPASNKKYLKFFFNQDIFELSTTSLSPIDPPPPHMEHGTWNIRVAWTLAVFAYRCIQPQKPHPALQEETHSTSVCKAGQNIQAANEPD